jgi:hypothetical protein
MLLSITIELETDYNESCDSHVSVVSACFPGYTQNILQFLSPSEQDDLQEALEDAYKKEAIKKVEELLHRKPMRLGTYRSPRTGT